MPREVLRRTCATWVRGCLPGLGATQPKVRKSEVGSGPGCLLLAIRGVLFGKWRQTSARCTCLPADVGRHAPHGADLRRDARALWMSDNTLYVGGEFSSVGVEPRSCAAAFSHAVERSTRGWRSGCYFVRMDVRGKRATRRMLVLR